MHRSDWHGVAGLAAMLGSIVLSVAIALLLAGWLS